METQKIKDVKKQHPRPSRFEYKGNWYSNIDWNGTREGKYGVWARREGTVEGSIFIGDDEEVAHGVPEPRFTEPQPSSK